MFDKLIAMVGNDSMIPYLAPWLDKRVELTILAFNEVTVIINGVLRQEGAGTGWYCLYVNGNDGNARIRFPANAVVKVWSHGSIELNTVVSSRR